MAQQFFLYSPCAECPFLRKYEDAFTLERLTEFAEGGFFICHKRGRRVRGQYRMKTDGSSPHCAGAAIFLAKRGTDNAGMQIGERLGVFEPARLNMKADVR